MRQHLHDLFDFQLSPHGSSRDRRAHRAHQLHRAAMARLARDDARPHPRTGERQVADTVQRLVSHEFVRPAQRGIQHSGIVEHHRVLRRRARIKPHAPQRFDFVHEPERSRARQLAARTGRAKSGSVLPVARSAWCGKSIVTSSSSAFARIRLVVGVALDDAHRLPEMSKYCTDPALLRRYPRSRAPRGTAARCRP